MRVILTLMWGVVLFAFWTAPEGWSADKKQPKKRPSNWPWKVEGLATDLARAKQDALDRARAEVTQRLRACHPPILAWKPSSDFIQEALVAKTEAKDVVVDGVAATRYIL